MRLGQNRRMRGRSRNNSKGPNPLTRTYESNGPDVKIRGTPQHIAEKYSQLARDAQGASDPVAAENYLQHAEHYFRIIAASQEQLRQQYGQRFDDDQEEGEGDENGNGYADDNNDQPSAEDVDYYHPQQAQPQPQPQQGYDNNHNSEGRQQRPQQRRSRYGRIDRDRNYNNNDQPRSENDGNSNGYNNSNNNSDDQNGIRRRSRFQRPQEQQQPHIEQVAAEPQPVVQRRPRVRAEVSDNDAPTGLPAFLTTPVPVRQAAPTRAEPAESLFGDVGADDAPKPVRRRRRVVSDQDAGGDA